MDYLFNFDHSNKDMFSSKLNSNLDVLYFIGDSYLNFSFDLKTLKNNFINKFFSFKSIFKESNNLLLKFGLFAFFENSKDINFLKKILKRFKNDSNIDFTFVQSVMGSTIAADNTFILDLEHPKLKYQLNLFREFTRDKSIEYFQIFDLCGEEIIDLVIGKPHSVFIPRNILLNAVKNGGEISIHNHPSKFNNMHSITDLITQVFVGIKYNIVESHTKRYIVFCDDLSLERKDSILNQLFIFKFNFKKEFTKVFKSVTCDVVFSGLSPREKYELFEKFYSAVFLSLMPRYERSMKNFFKRNPELNLYVYDNMGDKNG